MTLRASAFKPARLTLAAAVASLAVACGMVAETSDSESHFLVLCDGSCATGLSCICGVCTAPCSGDESCRAVAAQSSCRSLGERDCAGPAATSACDAACGSDVDCRTLGAQYRCVDAYCRADAVTLGNGGAGSSLQDDGTGGTGGTSAAGNTSAAGSGGTSPNGMGGGSGSGAGGNSPGRGRGCCPGLELSWGGPFLHVLTEACVFGDAGIEDLVCRTPLPDCGDPLRMDGEDVSALLALPDVAAAISERSVTFGWSGNVPDTSPDRVTIGGAAIFVWRVDCLEPEGSTPRPDCRPIPAGIRQLRQGLDTLAIQQLATGECAPAPWCYAPIEVANPDCGSSRSAFTYDPAQGQCIPTDPCTEPAFDADYCGSICRNDPCASGSLLVAGAPPECPGQGVTVNWPSDAGPISRCFVDGTRACLCACAVSGAPLESCRIDEVNPPAARCDAP